jgi:tripartite-type tricarboxylate transporter receptor subunit TctC
MQDLVGGQVKVGFIGMPNALPHARAGRLRALAVTSVNRSRELPEVPTLQEAGVPGYEATIWIGLLAPAETPRDIITRLRAEIARVLSAADAEAAFAATGVEVSLAGPEAFAAFVRAEYDKWGRVVRESGAQIN